MAGDQARQWAYTKLSDEGTLKLEIDGEEYEVVQYTASFALNEIPKATCMVAVGRDARSIDAAKKAKIHDTGANLSQMKKAKVTFTPKMEWEPKRGDQAKEWTGSEVIFEGYYVGLAYRKIKDRVQAVIHLIHWLVDLGFSSTLDKNNHPTNPTHLVAPACVPSEKTGLTGPPVYITFLVGREAIRNLVKVDLWEGMKTLLCSLTDAEKLQLPEGAESGDGDRKTNERAKEALKRIQGPSGGGCDMAYDSDMGGLPLKFYDAGVPALFESVSNAVTQQTLHSFAHTTFWDAIVGVYAPLFNIAIVPQVTVATVIADTPALGGKPEDQYRWKKVIKPGEYDAYDLTAMITRPLFGVGVYGDYEADTGYDITEPGKGQTVEFGGQYTSKAQEDADGMWLVVKSPPWLKGVTRSNVYVDKTSGVGAGGVSYTATTPGEGNVTPTEQTPGEMMSEVQKMYHRYAHSVYIMNMLRGRGASISGKLRFDIAPGSIIKIEANQEVFAAGEDKLATDLYGHVVRVTNNINAESKIANTTFQLNHIRTAKEFENDDRTRTEEHPLFGKDVYKGSPLVKNWVFA